jgi:hypothetical protein
MSTYKVYVSFPISSLTFGEASRQYRALKEMVPATIHLLNPLRGKECLAFLDGPILADAAKSALDEHDEALLSPQGLTQRDMWDCRRCDAALMILTRPSLGCMIELGWLSAFNKPVILVDEKGEARSHPMIASLPTYIVETKGAAVGLLLDLFS